AHYRNLARLWQLQAERGKADARLSAMRARIEAMQASLPKLQPEDQAVLDRHAKLLELSQEVNRAVNEAAEINGAVDALSSAVVRAQKINVDRAEQKSATVADAYDRLLTIKNTFGPIQATFTTNNGALSKSV